MTRLRGDVFCYRRRCDIPSFAGLHSIVTSSAASFVGEYPGKSPIHCGVSLPRRSSPKTWLESTAYVHAGSVPRINDTGCCPESAIDAQVGVY